MTKIHHTPEVGDKVRLVLVDDVLVATVEEQPSAKTRVTIDGDSAYITWYSDDTLRLEIDGECRHVECVEESQEGQSHLNDFGGFEKASEL